MAMITIRPTSPAEDCELLVPISLAFGFEVSAQRVERLQRIPELGMRLGAFDGDRLVGSAASWSFAVTTSPGVAVEAEGLTVVAVLPTHRRQGVLTALMRRHLDEARERGKVIAALFASEGSIYGRFGYGLASLGGHVELERDRSAFRGPAVVGARFRLLDLDEAVAAFPPIWERVRRSTPGMLSRSEGWWRWRRMWDPDWLRGGRPPLQRVLCELDGRPAGYALYRAAAAVQRETLVGSLDVLEAMGDGAAATRAVWRYLCDVDLSHTITASWLPVDHPLLHFLAEPSRARMRLADAIWIRLVDVPGALSQRGFDADGPPLVIEVDDAFCPWNRGSYRLADGKATRTDAAPDIALDVDALGSAYLGGFSFTRLADAGRAAERTEGALRRADALFRSGRAPWSPEVF